MKAIHFRAIGGGLLGLTTMVLAPEYWEIWQRLIFVGAFITGVVFVNWPHDD